MVVAAGDGDALTKAIEPYLADPELARCHAAQALAHVRKTFDIGNEVEGLNRVYAAAWQ
jgi:mannosyltransferase